MNFLDYIVVINLDSRNDDRLEEFKHEMKKMNIDKYERFAAIYNEVGLVGCGYSHIEVLKKARDNNYPYVLIFEDDFTFLVDYPKLEDNLKILSKYNKLVGFDVCFLSYNLIKNGDLLFNYEKQIEISDVDKSEMIKYCSRGLEVQTASGYIVMKHYYSKLIETLEHGVMMLEKTGQHWIYANDQIWKKNQKDDNWIYFKERIGLQRPSYSNNSNKYEVYCC